MEVLRNICLQEIFQLIVRNFIKRRDINFKKLAQRKFSVTSVLATI